MKYWFMCSFWTASDSTRSLGFLNAPCYTHTKTPAFETIQVWSKEVQKAAGLGSTPVFIAATPIQPMEKRHD